MQGRITNAHAVRTSGGKWIATGTLEKISNGFLKITEVDGKPLFSSHDTAIAWLKSLNV